MTLVRDGLGKAAILAIAAACFGACDNGIVPLRPDASPRDAGLRFGCPVHANAIASPGDPIDGDTYETLAQPFFTQYCVRCHSVTRTTREERNNAPAGYNWDDETSVRTNLFRIRAAIGEANFMPPEEPLPSCDERRRIVRWIDAAAP